MEDIANPETSATTESPASHIQSLLERAESYGKTTLELTKLKILEAVTIVVSTVVSRLIVLIVMAMFAIVLTTGVALYLGELLGKMYYGFFIVAAFYLLTGIVLHYLLNNWIKKPISDLIINEALQ
ncbi:MAG: hypothetical protein SH856_09490 [Flavobacteriales bacterium]|nr:hypothetical protein [Flavobacteriales bacterium]